MADIDPTHAVETLIERTVETLRMSFENFWPSDGAGNNDPCEQNVSMHLAHHLLAAGFSVFAEVFHPHVRRQGSKGRIDVLGIAPNGEWFLAFEAKRLLCNKPPECVRSMLDDVVRLRRFWLNDELGPSWLGQQRAQACDRCQIGVGMVGGLTWVPSGSRSPLVEFWQHKGARSDSEPYETLGNELGAVNATLPEPILAWRHGDSGAYFLLVAHFNILRPNLRVSRTGE